jgi:hypothetical protein
MAEGPELIFQPLPNVLDNRDIVMSSHGGISSPTRHYRKPSAPVPATKTLPSYSVPMEEIVVVERLLPGRGGSSTSTTTLGGGGGGSSNNNNNNSKADFLCKLSLTTIHHGILELELYTANDHDMLVAFLRSHLPKERVQIYVTNTAATMDCASVSSTCSSLSQLDVDRLQDKTIYNTVADETWPEKLSRRMSKVVHSLEVMSSTICDLTTCCRESPHFSNSVTVERGSFHTETRDAAPPQVQVPSSSSSFIKSHKLQPSNSWNMPVANGGHLEMDEGELSVMTGKSSCVGGIGDGRADDPALVPVSGGRSSRKSRTRN